MNKTVIHNDSDQPRYVAGRLIPPGESRAFSTHELPVEHRAAVVQVAAQTDPFAVVKDLLALPLKDLVPRLPGLPARQLEQLEQLENQSDKPRKGLLNEITAEVLRRAAAAETEDTMADFRTMLAEMGEPELVDQLAVFADDESRLVLVQQEIDRRAEANAKGGANANG